VFGITNPPTEINKRKNQTNFLKERKKEKEENKSPEVSLSLPTR
jgi:hypothetical protein